MNSTLTRDFAALLCNWRVDGEEHLERARLLLIDGLAVAAAGATEPGPQKVADLAKTRACRPQSTVICGGYATAPEMAARVNGMAMHVLDFEPMWDPPNHAISTIVPAVLALAEVLEQADGRPQGARALEAIIKGVEAQGRLRHASGQFEPRELTFHPPGIVGPIASAVACADLLGLDEAGFVAAIGVAASRSAGLMANVGSMTKALHCGDAAAHGLEAACLAARGFTADGDALGDPRGFARAFFDDRFDPDALIAPLRHVRVLNPGPAWKLFPSQYGTHFAITAAIDCLGDLQDKAAIEQVVIRSPVMPYIDRSHPRSGLDGKFSLQYCVAAALLDGRVGISTFSERRRFEADMKAFLDRIELLQDPTIPARFDAMYVDVAVHLAGGEIVERRCTAPLGSWSRPTSVAVVEAKARDLLNSAVGESRAADFWQAVKCDPSTMQVSQLMCCLRRGPDGRRP